MSEYLPHWPYIMIATALLMTSYMVWSDFFKDKENTSTNDSISAAFCIVLFMLGVWISFEAGLNIGRTEVASGEIICELAANKDKTTYWKCEAIEDEKEI